MQLRFKYFWIAFIVGFALLGLAIICRAVSRRETRFRRQRKSLPNDVGDEASIDSESSETRDLESTNATLSRWFRRSIEKPQATTLVTQNNTGTSATLMTTKAASRQDSIIGTHASFQRRTNPCATSRTLAVTPRISPDNPLHSQRGLHRSKFTFDEPPVSTESIQHGAGVADTSNAVTGKAEIIRSESWEQSIRRWTSVILASNAEAPDQSETIV
jgi:hypothetical protein